MRPLWIHYSADERSFAVDDSYLLGKNLLIAPILDQGKTEREIYLPGDSEIWYDFEGVTSHSGSNTITRKLSIDEVGVYQRGGSIVAKKERTRRASYMMKEDPYTLVVCLDKSGKANGNNE
jgi:alpha 1,3-glucosidase